MSCGIDNIFQLQLHALLARYFVVLLLVLLLVSRMLLEVTLGIFCDSWIFLDILDVRCTAYTLRGWLIWLAMRLSA